MIIEDAIRLFLPKYLSESEQEKLQKEIRGFPNNIDSRFYTDYLKDQLIIFQGDGIKGLKISNLPSENFLSAKCIITSNTCDIDSSNERFFESRLTYCPILSYKKYIKNLENKNISPNKLSNHTSAIKKQMISQILYLPANGSLEESIVFLDRTNNCNLTQINSEYVIENRMFTLSNYGFYMFLLKLSISFTRIRENINRK